MPTSTPIPAVFRIDIEPDEHQPKAREHWPGFIDMVAQVEQLRDRLSDLSGEAMHPTWFMRLDPDIERCFGHVDFVVRRHRDLFDQLIRHRDPLGIHVHAHRWDPERAVVFSDYGDDNWTRNCLTVAADVFEDCFGEPVRRSSQGGYFLSDKLLDAVVALGIEVDVTVEPGLGPRFADNSFGAYATAPSGDFRDCPQRPYYPSRQSFAVPASSQADTRPVLIVPLTAYDYQSLNAPLARRIAHRILGRPRQHLPLNPWKPWPSSKIYWDLVARAADSQPARYFAFAVRTDASDSATHRRVRELLEYLPRHPVARRLRFVDPLAPEIRALATPIPDRENGQPQHV